jgi:hypothetical protein
MDWAKSLPRDDQGRVLVPLFGDLKRHAMTDNQVDALGNELLSQRFVDRNIFQTAVNCGGWARPHPMATAMISPRLTKSFWPMAVRHANHAMPMLQARNDKSALIAFLKTLVIAP